MEKFLYTRNKDKGDYNFVMAYPAVEEFALSSLGYMWLYKEADIQDGVNVERISTDKPIISFRNTDSIAFSLSFDFDFLGVFEILEKNNVPFRSCQRDDKFPLIFAGGPVITTNPTPFINVFDFMIIGDGENTFHSIIELLKQKLPKTETLKKLSDIDGVFVPQKFSDKKKCNTQELKSVKKTTEKLVNVIYTPILSDKSYFKDTFIVEVQRGCMNRCAFCTASYLNLPFREYEFSKVIEAIDLGLKHTNKIALLGAQISAHSDFFKIMKYIEDKIDSGVKIELGISSLRTDTVTPELVRTLVKGGQKTSTIAIEAASERLRKFINKNLKTEQILNAVRISRENGLRGLKIYSMIGIPTETKEDIEEFINLAKILKSQNKGFELTFSFSSFVPKPHTPLQWSKREEIKTLEKKQKYLEKELAKLGVSSKFSSIKWDYWQTVLSRGDETFGEFLIEVYKNGGKNSAFKQALKTTGINIDKAVNGFGIEDVLPWDFVETEVRKELLINEFKRLSKHASL